MTALRISDDRVALADGVELAVRRLRYPMSAASSDRDRQSTKPTLVLLHEALGNIALWKGFPEALAIATDTDVLLYERCGYGDSSGEPLPRPDDYLIQEGSIWLPRLIDALRLDSIVLLGHSDGGSIALIAAGERPRQVRGLVTIAAHTVADPLTIKGIREAAERYRTIDLPQRLARYHGDRTGPLFEAWQQTWLRPSFQDSLDLGPWLGRIQCPALILQGEQDEYGLPEQVTDIVRGIGAHAAPGFIAGAGHGPHVQFPECVVELVRQFMMDCVPEARPEVTGPQSGRR